MFKYKTILFIVSLFSLTSFADYKNCGNDQIRARVMQIVPNVQRDLEGANSSIGEQELVAIYQSCALGFQLYDILRSKNKIEQLRKLKELKGYSADKLKGRKMTNDKIVNLVCRKRLNSYSRRFKKDVSYLLLVCENAYQYNLSY